jgi:hypothetical protein
MCLQPTHQSLDWEWVALYHSSFHSMPKLVLQTNKDCKFKCANVVSTWIVPTSLPKFSVNVTINVLVAK